MAVWGETENPFAARERVEVALGNNDGGLGGRELNLRLIALADAGVGGHGVGEDEIDGERVVLHLGHDAADAQGEEGVGVGDGGRLTHGELVDVVLVERRGEAEAVHNLDFAHFAAAADFLAGHAVDGTELSVAGGADDEVAQAGFGAAQALLLVGQLALGALGVQRGQGGVAAQALQLQLGATMAVVVLGFGQVQLGAALDAHAELLLVEAVLLLQPRELVGGLERLLTDGDALLLHLELFLLLRAEQAGVGGALVGNLLLQLGVGEDEEGVALAHHSALLGNDFADGAALDSTHTHGADGLEDAVGIDVLGELGLSDLADGDGIGGKPQRLGAKGDQHKGYKDDDGTGSGKELSAMADVPGAFGKGNVHCLLGVKVFGGVVFPEFPVSIRILWGGSIGSRRRLGCEGRRRGSSRC